MNRTLIAGALGLLIAVAPRIAAAQSAPAGPEVVATVDGAPVTRAEIEAFYRGLPAQYQQVPLEQIFPQLLERLIDQKLVAKAARAAGLDKKPEFRARLSALEEGLLNQAYMDERLAHAVSEPRLREAYQRAIALQPKRVEIHARHILVKTEAEAAAVVVALKGGADFAKLARDKSTGPSARNGGDLGFFGEGQMVPAFSEAAFALNVGEVTEKPVKTQFGWHVIKVEERRVAGQRSFEELKGEIQQQLVEAAYKEIMGGLRAGAKIEMKAQGGSKIQPLR